MENNGIKYKRIGIYHDYPVRVLPAIWSTLILFLVIPWIILKYSITKLNRNGKK